MKKKVARGLLAAILVSNSILGTTNMANAMSNTAEPNGLTLKTEENLTIETESNSTAITSEAEDTSLVEMEESSTEDTSSVEMDESSTSEVNSVEASEETNVSDNAESKSDSSSYQVKTKSVDNIDDFKTAIATSNTTIELSNNIIINEETINITANNITIEGGGHSITVKSATDKAALVVKSKNAVLNDLKIINESKKPGLTLYNAKAGSGDKGVVLSNVEIIGSKSGVALDIFNSTVNLTNITCSNSLYKDFQIRGGSIVTLNSENKHSDGIISLQTIQDKSKNETENVINNLGTYYFTPGTVTEDNDNKKVVDYDAIAYKYASNLEELLKYVKQSGAVIKLTDHITVDENDAAYVKTIEVGKNVTIDGNNKTLDLNNVASLLLKGNDIVVKKLEVVNSNSYGINIYNSKNVKLENIAVSNSLSHGIFVNGSIVDLHEFTTSSNGAEGIKITRATSLNSQNHVDSVVTVTGTNNKQEESDIDVIVVNLDINGTISNNKFIHEQGNIKYTEYHNEVVQTEHGWLDYTIDYVVEQAQLDVTDKEAVKNATGESIELVNDGVVDNTENLKKLIEYAASHSMELYFPKGTYKITSDIDLSELNLPAPAASNFSVIGDPDGLSIIDGSESDKMLKIFNVAEDHKMSYVDIEHLVFNNVGIALKGEYKKSLSLSNNVFMNGKNSGEMEAYIEVQLHGKKDFPVKNDPNNIKSIVNKIDSNIFLRGADNLGRGIVSTNNENIEITNNFFGNLEGIEDAKKMLPDTVDNKLDLVKDSNLTEGEQGNFYTAINSENDLDTLIQNNYFNLVKNGQKSEHIIFALGYENLQIVGNYFKGQENGTTGGVKISNGKNAYIGSNHFSDVPLLTYIDSSLANAEAQLHNTVIYNNLFHQKTNFGKEGTGITFDQSSNDGDVKDFIIYQNEFKSDERDGINLSERAQKAVNDNQFLAYGNTYKNTNKPVNYIGKVSLTESALADIEVKVDNHKGYTTYKDEAIPLTPPEVDYTYLKEIYDEAQKFLDVILNNDLVGDTPGKYPTNLVKQLQDMMAEIEELYNDGKLLQAGTNTFVTKLDDLYETVRQSRIPVNTGNSSGSGNNSGDGNGSGSGNNFGDGNGSGSENNSGDGNGLGSENNSGNGNEDSSESTGSTINKPTVDEQEKLDSLPQTGEVFNRVLTALGILFIITAGLLLMKRPKTE